MNHPTLIGQWIAGGACHIGDSFFRAHDPFTGEQMGPKVVEATLNQVNRAAESAQAIAADCRNLQKDQRLSLLEAIHKNLSDARAELEQAACAESAYPAARCAREVDRVLGSLAHFSEELRSGRCFQASEDAGALDNKPLPKPRLHQTRVAIGPVAVFGAANFPIAISVLSADTLSALTTGCPVIFKAHPEQPLSCHLASEILARSLADCGLPPAFFQILHGRSTGIGQALVQHPSIKAVAFTGSLTGGRSIMDSCAARPNPIQVYAEMGSVNPVFFLPNSIINPAALAQSFFNAMTLGNGQFCTQPGVIIGSRSEEWASFLQILSEKLDASNEQPLLHDGIFRAYQKGIADLLGNPLTNILTKPPTYGTGGGYHVPAVLAEAAAGELLSQADQFWLDEIFGPATLAITCDTDTDYLDLANSWKGSLTASIHAASENSLSTRLLSICEGFAGRIIFDGFPVGLEPNYSMHHGGPYPAASHPLFTSVGGRCLSRFLRPVCYQHPPTS